MSETSQSKSKPRCIPIRPATLTAIHEAFSKASFVLRFTADDERQERRKGMAREAETAILKASRMLSKDQAS